MSYLFIAYTIVWFLIFAYVMSLGGKQKRIDQELQNLKRMVEDKK